MDKPNLKLYAQTWHAELLKNLPWRKPVPREEVILERFVHSLFFKPATVRVIEGHNEHGRRADGWNEFAWVHQARRDRSGGKVGYFATRNQVWTLLDDACGLAYNLWEIGSLIGIPNALNPYKDDDSSLTCWTPVSTTLLVPPVTTKKVSKPRRQPVYSGATGGNIMDLLEQLRKEYEELGTVIKVLERRGGSAVAHSPKSPKGQPKRHGRHWTPAMRAAMSKRIKAAIAAKKAKKTHKVTRKPKAAAKAAPAAS
jgi:hypothetical protein